jgi:hypothetical protein
MLMMILCGCGFQIILVILGLILGCCFYLDRRKSRRQLIQTAHVKLHDILVAPGISDSVIDSDIAPVHTPIFPAPSLKKKPTQFALNTQFETPGESLDNDDDEDSSVGEWDSRDVYDIMGTLMQNVPHSTSSEFMQRLDAAVDGMSESTDGETVIDPQELYDNAGNFKGHRMEWMQKQLTIRQETNDCKLP